MRCTVCHQEYKQIDMVDNYFVKDTSEATSTSVENSTQVSISSVILIWLEHNNLSISPTNLALVNNWFKMLKIRINPVSP